MFFGTSYNVDNTSVKKNVDNTWNFVVSFLFLILQNINLLDIYLPIIFIEKI
jgi:hypothetical protein